MIYELRNKIPQNSSFIYSEDVLTGTVFGNLRYFSKPHLLIGFLNEAIDNRNSKLSLPVEQHFDIHFWKKYLTLGTNNYNEPDVVLFNDDTVIIIECKYFSVLNEDTIIKKNGGKEYINQLIRYSRVITAYYADRKNQIIIFLTNDKTKPSEILTRTEKNIPGGISLYWLSWTKLYDVIQAGYIEYTLDNAILLKDIEDFLLKRNLYTFNGFDLQAVEYKRFYQRYYNFNMITDKIRWHYTLKEKMYFAGIALNNCFGYSFYEECYFSVLKNNENIWRYKK
jgi:hypothetical protein